ncbi:MAG TPA: outer membrane protein assembly factor BamD [Acidobacteriota bacterium]|jgi:outer membrane protein assembly factor BamD
MKLKFCFYALILLLTMAGCHRQKSANLQKGGVPPDRVLYQNGMKYLSKGQYLKARLAFETLISTYPDSEFTPKSVMAMGDSYYEEGGSANLLQAEAQYRNYILFYPNYEDADDAQMKIAALDYKMMKDAGLDQTYTRKAEVELKKMIQNFPNSELLSTAREMLRDVQEVLARSEQEVGDFYLQRRNNYVAAESRYKVVLEKYPTFSEIDQTYFKMGDALQKRGSITEAIVYYNRIVAGFPFSDKFEEAKKRLILLEKPVPPVDPVLAAENEKNRIVKDFSIFDPVRSVWQVFAGKEDPYERAKRNAAAKTAQPEPKKNGKDKKTKTKGDALVAAPSNGASVDRPDGAQIQDRTIDTQVKSALKVLPSKSVDLSFKVKDGIVTLHGKARDKIALDQAVRTISAIAGVRRVEVNAVKIK